jgi:multidrug efflux pump subunit AcrB
LRTVSGLAEINSTGGYDKQLVVQPDPEKLRTSNVTFDELARIIGENVENAGGGVVNQGAEQLIIRSVGRVQTAEDIAKGLVNETFPDTKTAYQIPNAMVGYVPGYGLVADCWPQGANSNYMRMRVIAMVAIKNNLALIAAAVGPFRQFGPDFGLGKPSGANLQLALDMGKYVNSFSWRGDPPR